MNEFKRLELYKNGRIVYSAIGSEQYIRQLAEVYEMTGAKAVVSAVENPLPNALKETWQ